MNKKILYTTTLFLTVLLVVLALTLRQGEHYMASGILVKSFEDLYFTEDLQDFLIDDDKQIWVIDPTEAIQVDIDELEWTLVEDKFGTEYTHVQVEGRRYGPGTYGRAGKTYKYELRIDSIKALVL